MKTKITLVLLILALITSCNKKEMATNPIINSVLSQNADVKIISEPGYNKSSYLDYFSNTNGAFQLSSQGVVGYLGNGWKPQITISGRVKNLKGEYFDAGNLEIGNMSYTPAANTENSYLRDIDETSGYQILRNLYGQKTTIKLKNKNGGYTFNNSTYIPMEIDNPNYSTKSINYLDKTSVNQIKWNIDANNTNGVAIIISRVEANKNYPVTVIIAQDDGSYDITPEILSPYSSANEAEISLMRGFVMSTQGTDGLTYQTVCFSRTDCNYTLINKPKN